MGGRWRIAFRGGILGWFVTAALAAPALGLDHGIPRTQLSVDGKYLRGSAWSTQENHPTGPNQCVTGFEDGFPAVDRHVKVDAGRHEVSLVFLRSDRPKGVDVSVYRHLDRYRSPTGRWSDKTITLEPFDRHGRTVGWSATFSIKLEGRRYVDAFAVWPDEDGCGEDNASFVYPGLRPE